MIVKTEADTIEDYLKDASNFHGKADSVFIPESIDELKQLVRQAAGASTLLSIAGAGTGLAGGRAPLGGWVVSMEKFNKILSIDYENRIARTEPMALHSELDAELAANGFFFPPNPTEKNSSLGGNAATNASGARTFKYGSTRNFVRSLRIILPDGNEIKLRRGEVFADGYKLEFELPSGDSYLLELPRIKMPDVKHAAGYFVAPGMDAIDLFIGSEGTLGIITELELEFIQAPEAVMGAIVFFDNDKGLVNFVEEARKFGKMNNNLPYRELQSISPRLIEFYDKYSLDLLRDTYSQIPAAAHSAIWLEQEYALDKEDFFLDSWNELISRHSSLANETWIALSAAEHENFRQFRHEIPLRSVDIYAKSAQTKIGTDGAVPDAKLREFFEFITENIEKTRVAYIIYGHIGNSHLHINIFPKSEQERSRAMAFYDSYIDKVISFGGTVSAEHGIGKIKKKYLKRMYGSAAIEEMKGLKLALDPANILSQGNMFD